MAFRRAPPCASVQTHIDMTSSRPIVYVVDDDPYLRKIIVQLLERVGYDAEAFASAEEFLRQRRDERLAVLLLDVMLLGASGFDVIAELERRGDSMPTIFMTGGGSIPMSVRAMKAGAVEFLTKPVEWDVLRPAIEQALDRAVAATAVRAESARLQEMVDRLTPRERVVLLYVARGLMNKQIAADLDIVEQTVKVHRARIMQKLEAGSVADLVRLVDRAAAHGIPVAPPTVTDAH